MKASKSSKTQSVAKTIDEIYASAKAANAIKRERARDVNNRDAAETERLANSDISQGQISALRKMADALGRTFDERPLRDGGTVSRLKASELMDEWGAELKARREALRAGPATEGQLNALVRCGCKPREIKGISYGDASDLLNRFVADIEARKKQA